MADFLSHAREVWVLHDADTPGREGAEKWSNAIAALGNSIVRNVQLPFEVAETHGKDARDFIIEHGDRAFDELRKLAEKTEPIDPKTVKQTKDSAKVSRLESSRQDGVWNFYFKKGSGGGDEEPTAVPHTIHTILQKVSRETAGFPKSAAGVLFEHTSDHVNWLQKTEDLFGWLHEFGGVRWAEGAKAGFVTKGELFANLKRTAKRYASIEQCPHEPRLPDSYYACEMDFEPGDGSRLNELIAKFEPATPTDLYLIKAAFATPMWGGPPGARPAFVLTSDDGRGVGKSTLVKLISQLYGGCVDVGGGEDISAIKTRLLSAEGLLLRVAVVDNVKTYKFSWSELESLITSSNVSGHRMYQGEAQRPNHLTWFITLNGASLSKDLAQRSIVIKLRRPKHDSGWEDGCTSFIRDHRDELFADLRGFLRAKQTDLAQYSRWSVWDRDILSRLPNPAEAQALVADRQRDADVEDEEADHIQGYFDEKMDSLHYSSKDVVFMPSRIATVWLREITNEPRLTTTTASRRLRQMVREKSLRRIGEASGRTHGRGFTWHGDTADWDARMQTDLETRLERTSVS